MPAKKQITKAIISEKSFDYVRRKGIDALNMRDVAKECKCSTQPIYLAYKGIDELKQDIAQRAYEEFNNCLLKEIKSGIYPEYKAIGIGYIRFAIEERELFKYLFMRNRSKDKGGVEQNSFDGAIMTIMKNYGLYRDDAVTLHAEMWIFVHGIATMIATDYLDWDFETINRMITDAYKGLITNINKGDKNDS